MQGKRLTEQSGKPSCLAQFRWYAAHHVGSIPLVLSLSAEPINVANLAAAPGAVHRHQAADLYGIALMQDGIRS